MLTFSSSRLTNLPSIFGRIKILFLLMLSFLIDWDITGNSLSWLSERFKISSLDNYKREGIIFNLFPTKFSDLSILYLNISYGNYLRPFPQIDISVWLLYFFSILATKLPEKSIYFFMMYFRLFSECCCFFRSRFLSDRPPEFFLTNVLISFSTIFFYFCFLSLDDRQTFI